MERKKAVINSLMGLACQLVTTIFSFILRSVLIRTVGVEIIGLNSTFASVLSALSLAELGFQTSVVFALYQPLYDRNKELINEILNVFKLIYRIIGIFFIVCSVLLLPFLKYILKGIEINDKIYLYFLLQAGASAASYLLAYKRTLLYADRNDYISKIVDLLTYFVFSILEISVLIGTNNYGLYLILRIIQVCVSNIIIQIICSKKYPYIRKTKFNVALFKNIFKNVKDVFLNRFAAYIYSSTDSIVISSIISTVAVGYYTNYNTISYGIKLLINALLHPITPSIGNYVVSNDDVNKHIRLFKQYSHLRYLIALAIVIPFFILVDEFISLWIGREYILSALFTSLITADMYIHIVHSSLCDFINVYGMFRKDKYIEIVGAITNIVLSVIFARRLGIEGVLIGTVIGQFVFWIGRSVLVFRDGFRCDWTYLFKYWIRNIIYFAVAILIITICMVLYHIFNNEYGILHFILCGFSLEIVIIFISTLVFSRTKEHKEIMRFARSGISSLLKDTNKTI